MKKKLLVLVAMLLCVVTVLASCASSMKFGKIVGDGTYNDENPTLTTSAKLDVKGEYSSALSKGDLAVFVDYDSEKMLNTYTIYNVATGATVWTAAETKSESATVTTTVRYNVVINDQWDTNWFKVTTVTTTVTVSENDVDTDVKNDLKYYSVAGTEFAALADYEDQDLATAWTMQDLICLDNKVYRIADDATIAYAFDWNELRKLPSVQKVGDFYLGSVSSYDGSVAVYDASLNLVTMYMLPSYVAGDTENIGFVLSNGNVLIQYYVAADIMAEEYTFLMDFEYGGTPGKYNLYSFLLDAENGKIKELDLDFIVMDVEFKRANDDNWFYNEKVENVAYVIYVEDQRINFTPYAQKLASLSNKGQIKGVIEPIDNMLNLNQVATNRWIATNLAGQAFLLNEKGEVLGEVTKASNATKKADFFILNEKIYDWDLNVKYDMAENKIDDYEVMSHGVLMINEDDEILLYANGTVTTLVAKDVDDKDVEPISNDLFVIATETETGEKYEFCNSVGTVVLTLENVELDDIVCVADSNNALLIVVETIPAEGEEAQIVYYRIG